MKTKIVTIDDQKIKLFKNETDGKWYNEQSQAVDYFHQYVMNSDDRKARTIRQYYCESTVEYTRNKIREMINREKGNLDQLYDTIINIKLERIPEGHQWKL